MRVALYERNSKPPRGWKPSGPGEEPPGSWKLQQARLRELAQRQGVEVALDEHDVVTGEDPNRPAWDRVLAAIALPRPAPPVDAREAVEVV